MKILAFDTAMKSCAVACIEVDVASAATHVLAEEIALMSRGQAEELVPMIARVMDRAELAFPELDRIALSIGPGTFTGLRTGLATARGLGLASGLPVVGVGTLQALAWDRVHSEISPDNGTTSAAPTTPFAIVLDARRGQVYWQLFASPTEPLGAPEVLVIEEAAANLPGGRLGLVGSGADILMNALQGRRSDIQIIPLANENGPSPRAIATLAASRQPDKEPPSPLYLRPPDAKPQNHVPLARQ